MFELKLWETKLCAATGVFLSILSGLAQAGKLHPAAQIEIFSRNL
jgi:hypothetical protein